VDALGINLGFFIAQIINFGIIFLILSVLVWPRVTQMLDERAERIAKGLEDQRAAEEALANAERERDELLRQARSEGQKVIEEARQRGDEQVKQMLDEAKAEAEKVRTDAREEARNERESILAEARDDIVSIAIAASERLIGDSLDDKKQRAIISDFFSDVPADAKNMGGQVTVISAVPLTDSEKAQVTKVTGADDVTYKVVPSILGGLVLRSGDQVVDSSVRGDLSALSLQLQ